MRHSKRKRASGKCLCSKIEITIFLGGMDEYSWALCSDNIIRHNKQELFRLSNISNSNSTQVSNNIETAPNQQSTQPTDGDIIGVSYDHIQLKFYHNGKEIESPVTNVKGTVYPALYGKFIISNFSFIY